MRRDRLLRHYCLYPRCTTVISGYKPLCPADWRHTPDHLKHAWRTAKASRDIPALADATVAVVEWARTQDITLQEHP